MKKLGHILGAILLIWIGCQVLGWMGNHGMIGPAVTVPASDNYGSSKNG